MSANNFARPVGAIALGVVVFVAVLRLPMTDELVGSAIDDLVVLAGAAAAAVCGCRRAHLSTGPLRRSWALLAAGFGCWAGGEAVWTYYELLARRETPFPSPADGGFLLFPVVAGLGLLLWPSAALRSGTRWRTLLDGTLVAGSLFLLSWVTVLHSVVHVGADSLFAFAVSVAYPAADLILLTMTVIVVAHARHAVESGLVMVAAGISCLCFADSGFAYLTATDRYASGSLADAGWVAGFLLIAVAAASPSDVAAKAMRVSSVDDSVALEPAGKTLLPYVPAGIGLAAGMVAGLTGRGSAVVVVGAGVVVAALLGRQLLAMADNRRLVRQLLTAQQALHHQAFHDPLTGLANRALFSDRLRHGLELHRRDLRPLSLLFCDLDGFKKVNDTLGHDAGDSVLKAAAERLQAVTRRGDTLARLGGDEFAILLEDGGDPPAVATRILDGFARPIPIDTHVVAVGASIGIAVLDAASITVTPTELLRRADSAMYAAKHNGKGTACTWHQTVSTP